MTDVLQPGRLARRAMLRAAMGAGAGVIVAMGMRVSRAADGGNNITIDNFSFAPALLKVKVGTIVTWTNHDDTIHSIVCLALKFRSKPLDTNDSFSYTFTTVGDYDYICGIHPHMHGQVVVTA